MCKKETCLIMNVEYTVKTLSLLQPHFRSSQLHQCDQGMLPNTCRFSSEVLLLELTIISEDLFDYILGISTSTKQQRNSIMGRCVRPKQTRNLTRNDDLYMN